MDEKPNEQNVEEVNVTGTQNNEVKVETSNESPNNGETTINTGFKKVQKKKKTNFGKFFFVILLLAAITAGIWYFVYYQPLQNSNNTQGNNENNNQETIKIEEAKVWEKTYAKILTDENNYKNYNSIQIQLIKLNRNDQIPVMVVTYDSTRNPFEKVLDVWKTDENGTSIEKVDNCSTTDDSLKILYDVKEGVYDWYIYNKSSETEAYGNLARILDNTRSTTNSIENSIFGISKMGTFNFYDYVVSDNQLMGNIKKEQFEEKYIVINSKDLKNTWVELKINEIDENEVLKTLIQEEKLNKNASSVVSDIKDSIFAKADEILKKSAEKNNTIIEENTNNANVNDPNANNNNENNTNNFNNNLNNENNTNNANNINNVNENNTNTTNTNENNINVITPNNQLQQETTQSQNQDVTDIGQEEALKVAKKIFGDESDGRKMSYSYLAWVNDTNGKKYYAYRVSWLVNNDHYSFVDTLLISADGKTYKEIGTPENFVDGQTVTKFDVEGNV